MNVYKLNITWNIPSIFFVARIRQLLIFFGQIHIYVLSSINDSDTLQVLSDFVIYFKTLLSTFLKCNGRKKFPLTQKMFP